MQNEFDSLSQNKTRVLVDLPPRTKPINYKWRFRRKLNPDGSIDKYKTRLIAVGFTQKGNVYYFNTPVHVIRISFIHVPITLSYIINLLFARWM